MNLIQLQYFIDIVHFGTFSEAAFQNHISQSALSKQIKSLEIELGTALFARKHSRSILTECGKLFLPFAKQTITSYRDILHTFAIYNPEQDRHIALGSIPIGSMESISSLLADFQTDIDQLINIDVYEESQQAILSLLDNAVIDIAFVRTESLMNKEAYNFSFYRKDRLACVCPLHHPFAQCTTVAFKDLSQENIILLDNKSSLYHLGVNELTKQEIVCNILCTVSRHNIILEMVSRGLGISLLPQNLLHQKEPHTYAVIPLSEDIFSEIAMVRKKDHYFSPIKQKIWQFLSSQISHKINQ